jgi:hypothetical protein
MRTLFLFSRAVCACVFLLSFASCEKKNVPPTAVEQSFTPNFTLAKTNSELATIQANPTANTVRTRQDLDTLISSNKSPLIKLSAADRADFLDKLVFRENVGVVSFYYGDVAAKLSYDAKQGFWGLSQDPAINQQLENGGSTPAKSFVNNQEVQSRVPDYKNYMCFGRGSCYQADGWICMSGC